MNNRFRKTLAVAMVLMMLVHETEAVNMPLTMRGIPLGAPATTRVSMPSQEIILEPSRPSENAGPKTSLSGALLNVAGLWIARFGDRRRRIGDSAARWAGKATYAFFMAVRFVGGRVVDLWESYQDSSPRDVEKVRWPALQPEPSLALPITPRADDRARMIVTHADVVGVADGGNILPFAEGATTKKEEPMIEKAPVRPKLQPMASLSDFATESQGKTGFRTIQLNRAKEIWITRFRNFGQTDQPRKIPQAQNIVNFRQAPIRLPGGQEVGTQDINTDFNRYLITRYKLLKAEDGVEVFLDADGTRITHTYDQTKPIAERNTEVYERPDGSTQTTVHSPLVFDLNGNGVRASDRLVRFDLSGKGRIERFHDIGAGGGVLVFDSDGDGISGTSGRELFGDATDISGHGNPGGFKDGFEALEGLIRKAETERVLSAGTLERRRLGPRELELLHRRYGLGMRIGSLANKTVSLKEAGVSEIVLSREPSIRVPNFDGQHDDVVRRRGAYFVRADGSRGSYEDIFFNYEPAALRQVAFGGK